MFGPIGELFVVPVHYFLKSQMTAISIYYVLPGFCLAADGRVTHVGDGETVVTSDCTVKIFEARTLKFSGAYILTGEVLSDDLTYDLVAEVKALTSNLSSKPFLSFNDYCHKFGEKIKRKLTAFKKAKKLSDSFTVEVSLVGYFDGLAVWTIFEFDHKGKTIAMNMNKKPIVNGQNHSRGSSIVPKLAQDGDSRLSKYYESLNQIPSQMSSLNDAAKYVTAYVQCCCDPCAQEIDHHCKIMGGHVHVAELTPAGFRWRIPPLGQ